MSTASHESRESSVKSLSAGEKRADPPPNPRVVIPDGGFQAWATVAGSFLIMFCGFGYCSSFGVYQDFYVRTYLLDTSPSAISWIGSVNIFIVLSGGFIAGRLHDRGYFYSLMYGGSLLMALSLFMLSLARPNQFYQVFLAQGIAHGLGAGLTYVPCVAVLSHHFTQRRALAMAIVASGSSLGAVVHPIMLNNTLRSQLGFAGAVRASAGLISGLLLVACLLMRTRVVPPAPKQPDVNFMQTVRRFVRDRAYVVASIGLGIYTIGFYYPLFYLQLDAVQHGIDPTFAFYVLVIMNASSFLGRLFPGLVAHRWGVKPMITAAAGCGAALILAMSAFHDLASTVTIGVLYGFCAGSIIGLMGPLLAVLTDDMSELGTRMGISVALSGVGILIGPPIDGLLLTSEFIWWRPALFSGVMAVVGFFCFLFVLLLHRRKSKRAAVPVVVELGLELDSL
ncbi:MFS general substrate transporter [Mycena alexandri]|uniref:MFS general substrate transporter n=1 Tax=Mycena alexandri TaxID=1745969 RepID=A0AAD6SZG9_9AGAR|nr:MFS general substrate transporter [Mycena alexandri]